MKHFALGTTGAVTLGAALLAAPLCTLQAADTPSGAKIGTLTCKSVPGTRRSILIHSSVEVSCDYKEGIVEEKYKGETGIALGVDLNLKQDETLAWAVFAPASDVSAGNYALAGKYTGAKASATVGVGVGANVLIGGGKKSFTLQPVSLTGSKGVGVAGGVGYLYLESDKP
ncbi:MAG: DUF992 domain-containing protein [Gammaproteobacteria bacterium]